MTNRFRKANDVQRSWCAVPVNAPSRGRAHRARRKMECWSVDESFAHRGRTGRPVPEGLSDRSQAIYRLVSVQEGEPSRRARYDWVR